MIDFCIRGTFLFPREIFGEFASSLKIWGIRQHQIYLVAKFSEANLGPELFVKIYRFSSQVSDVFPGTNVVHAINAARVQTFFWYK